MLLLLCPALAVMCDWSLPSKREVALCWTSLRSCELRVRAESEPSSECAPSPKRAYWHPRQGRVTLYITFSNPRALSRLISSDLSVLTNISLP